MPSPVELHPSGETLCRVGGGRWLDRLEFSGPQPPDKVEVVLEGHNLEVEALLPGKPALGRHPAETGDAYRDHSQHAAWLGEKLPLNLDVLKDV